MPVKSLFHRIVLASRGVCLALALVCLAPLVAQAEVLVADRLGQRVVAYTDSGDFSHVVATGIAGGGPSGGLAISPDGQYLYAAGISALHRFDWDANTLTGSNRVQIAGSFGSSSVVSPAGLIFDEDTLFVANRGASTVARLNANGTSQATNLTGGDSGGRTALAFDPSGNLLVGNFSNGAIHRYNTSTGYLDNLVPTTAMGGILGSVAAMLAVGDDLFVATGGSGKIAKFDINTGTLDPTFGIGGIIDTDASIGNAPLVWPSALSLAPDGNGLLLGVLTATNGGGYINQLAFDGTYVGRWATNSSSNLALGFGEATGLMTLVPEPGAIVLAAFGLAAIALRAKRRSKS